MIDDVIKSETERIRGDDKKDSEPRALQTVSGFVGEFKKGPFKKFADTFFEEDLPTVKRSLISNLIIPRIKDFLVDTLIGVVEGVFYGSGVSKRREKRDYSTGVRNLSSVSWRSYYANKREVASVTEKDDDFKFNNIVMVNRQKATELLDIMKQHVAKYDSISIAELYEIVEKPELIKFPDNYHGWTDLSDAYPRRVSNGWLVYLPEPEQLRSE